MPSTKIKSTFISDAPFAFLNTLFVHLFPKKVNGKTGSFHFRFCSLFACKIAFKDLLGNDADEETVTRAIQDMLKRSNEYIPTPEAILEYISKYYNLEESVIRGQQRIRDAVQARQIAMYLIRSMTNLSLEDIGRQFDNRDHSTVLYSIKEVEKKMKKDPSFAETVKAIKTNINSRR